MAGCTFGLLSLTLLACMQGTQHRNTIPHFIEICVPHITCGFHLVTFQLLLFFKEGNYKAIIYNDHYTEGQKGMIGCHAVHLVV